MKESKEGREGGKGRRGRSKRCTESRGTRGIIRPSRSPDALPAIPFLLTSCTLYPCTTPLDDSRHSLHPLPPAPFPFLRPCFSHSVALYFAPCLDFMCTAKWGYFAPVCDKRARNGKIIVSLLPKLIYISSFDVF